MEGQWQYKRVLGLSIFSDFHCAFKLKMKKHIYILCDRLFRPVVKANLVYIFVIFATGSSAEAGAAWRGATRRDTDIF